VIVRIKKEYNEVIEEIIKRLAEKNLYMKLEKCKWKVKEVEFFKVVIGLEEIKIEKKKDEGSTRLANFQKVKKFLRLANYYSVRIQDNRLGLFYCPCSFLFIYCLFWYFELRIRISIILHISHTCHSYSHMIT